MRFEDRLQVTWAIEPGERMRSFCLFRFKPWWRTRSDTGLRSGGARDPRHRARAPVDGALELFVEDDGPPRIPSLPRALPRGGAGTAPR